MVILTREPARAFQIVLTGAPVAGKSLTIRVLQIILEGLGYTVIPVSETATRLFIELGDQSAGTPLDITKFYATDVADV